MITKLPSNNQEGKYDLKVADKNDKSFTMTIGGYENMLRLVEPCEMYINQYIEAYFLSKEKIQHGEMKAFDLMFVSPQENILEKLEKRKSPDRIKIGKVPWHEYFLVDDDTFVGVVTIRLEMNNELLNYGGNIGYGINPKFWNKGYGSQALKLGLIKAKELGMTRRVLVTCDVDNVASAKIIEKNCGVLENTIENIIDDTKIYTKRYWIDL